MYPKEAGSKVVLSTSAIPCAVRRDAIIEKYGFFIASCVSGGGRNHLKSMKRGVPLHYTDWFNGNHEDYNMKGKNTQVLFKWFLYIKKEVYQNSLYKRCMNYAPFCLLKRYAEA